MHAIPYRHPAGATVAAKPGTSSSGAVPPDHAGPIFAKITAVLMLWIALGFLLALAAPKSSLSGEFFTGDAGPAAAKRPPG